MTDCPCGSGMTYVACCEPFHRGRALAPTATALMRSRYSAYALGDADYLLASWHPSTRPAGVDLEEQVEWRRLKIRSSTGGGAEELTGAVEFVAHYWDGEAREYGRLEETSRFIRQNGRWLYLDALEP